MSENVQLNTGQRFKQVVNNRQNFDSGGAGVVFNYSKGGNDLKSDLVQFGTEFTATYDKDGDGISLDEFVKSEAEDYKKMFPGETIKPANQKAIDELNKATFEQFDTDCNQKVDSKEMTAYLATLDGMDGSVDGNIQYSSFKNFSEALLTSSAQAKSVLLNLKNAIFPQG